MIKICTVYFEGFYTPDYVSKLYRSLKRNSTVPFEFVCISDTDVEADIVLPYNHQSNIKKHWLDLQCVSYFILKMSINSVSTSLAKVILWLRWS